MKRLAAWILTLACVWVLTGCCNRSMDYIIQHEPNISGTVKEVRDESILISIEAAGYPAGADCEVSLDVENPDSYTHVSIGGRGRGLLRREHRRKLPYANQHSLCHHIENTCKPKGCLIKSK